jgi:hypothetical protein
LTIRPLRSSNIVSSASAIPMPIMMPPRNWLLAVLGLMPAAVEQAEPARDAHSPVSSVMRTSWNCAPYDTR